MCTLTPFLKIQAALVNTKIKGLTREVGDPLGVMDKDLHAGQSPLDML